MKIQIGAFLTKVMSQTLKYKVGRKERPLLEHGTERSSATKHTGFVAFNTGFLQQFVEELDKIHDLNMQLQRSVPMIYRPAPWKNFNFGGYYLKQTKMAKVHPHFRMAARYLQRADLSTLCGVLDYLGSVQWRVN